MTVEFERQVFNNLVRGLSLRRRQRSRGKFYQNTWSCLDYEQLFFLAANSVATTTNSNTTTKGIANAISPTENPADKTSTVKTTGNTVSTATTTRTPYQLTQQQQL